MSEGYTRRSNRIRDIQPVGIIGVDTATTRSRAIAKGFTRDRDTIDIDCGYAVGGQLITPAVGEQWYVERYDAVWRLVSRIPWNDDNLLIEPVQGQTVVGGTGPYVVNGSCTSVSGWLQLPSYSTTALPDPVEVGVGAVVYNTTLSKPVLSDGTVWRDSTGAAI